MGKRPALASADARPRVHFRMVGAQAQVAAIGCGPWKDVADVLDGIDMIAGEDAWQAPAVVIWEGQVDAS